MATGGGAARSDGRGGEVAGRRAEALGALGHGGPWAAAAGRRAAGPASGPGGPAAREAAVADVAGGSWMARGGTDASGPIRTCPAAERG